jgi:hypothetical protein
MMPKMDGIEAVSIIRGFGYERPIVALTANAVSGASEMYLSKGFDGFISKPVDMRELNATLNKLIRDKQPPDVIKAARKKLQALDSAAVQKTGISDELMAAVAKDIGNALSVLEEILPGINNPDAADIKLFTTIVHGLKSPLINVGETELSSTALRLEQAGNSGDIEVISSETPAFMRSLRSLADKHKPKERDDTGEISPDDLIFLRSRLNGIKTACERIKKKDAKAALDELNQKAWPRATNDLLDELTEHLLHGEFKKAVTAVDQILFS